ncbi:Hypothetical predicted protein, partial [Olea europaea subsp. europaea]
NLRGYPEKVSDDYFRKSIFTATKRIVSSIPAGKGGKVDQFVVTLKFDVALFYLKRIRAQATRFIVDAWCTVLDAGLSFELIV